MPKFSLDLIKLISVDTLCLIIVKAINKFSFKYMQEKIDKTKKVGKKAEDAPGSLYPDKTIQLDNAAFQDLLDPLKTGSLLIISGSPADIGNHILIEGRVIVGRDPAELQIHDSGISRKHAYIEFSDGKYYVNDLGSTNGTLLNGRQLTQPAELNEGDKILLGHTILKFMLIDGTEADYLRNMGHMAGIDHLTGLPAKHRFDSLLQEAIRSAIAAKTPLSIMMMDMDGLKAINDKHGHQMGAHTISRVGNIIGKIIRGKGEASRFGGDEFCAMLPRIDKNRAIIIGEQIRQEVEKAEFCLKGVSVRATISIGVAELCKDASTEEEIIALADQALYRCKKKGRNNVSD